MIFRQLFDRDSSTYTYLLGDPEAGVALLIDPVREQVDRDLQLLDELGLELVAIVETHVHADHITAAWLLKERTGAQIVYPETSSADGADRTVGTGDVVEAGSVKLETRLTPGHTAGSASYVLADHSMVFTGDTLLIRGCGRTDFQEGDAHALYRSVHEQLFTLPDACLVYPGHDYTGRTVSSIREEKAHNPRLGGGRSEAEFVAIMDGLDLSYPAKIDEAVPANRRLGRPTDPFGLLERERGVLQAPVSWVLEHGDAVRVVDVRSPEEYDGPLGHIEGAELVPLDTLDAASSHWDHDAPVVVICRSGGRSDRGAGLLQRKGFTKVASMTGGMLAYRDVPQPTATGTCG